MISTPPDEMLSKETEDEIDAIVRGIAPLDWVQMRLTAALTPAQRIQTAMRAAEFAKAIYRDSLRMRFPDMPLVELNMRVLAHFTRVRLSRRAWDRIIRRDTKSL
jgi:hypothetical protein